jgi:hypothetical protein
MLHGSKALNLGGEWDGAGVGTKQPTQKAKVDLNFGLRLRFCDGTWDQELRSS